MKKVLKESDVQLLDLFENSIRQEIYYSNTKTYSPLHIEQYKADARYLRKKILKKMSDD